MKVVILVWISGFLFALPLLLHHYRFPPSKQKVSPIVHRKRRQEARNLTWKVKLIKENEDGNHQILSLTNREPVSSFATLQSRTAFITFCISTLVRGTRIPGKETGRRGERNLTCGIGGSKAEHSGEDVIIGHQRRCDE